jgi:hypothetical protein
MYHRENTMGEFGLVSRLEIVAGSCEQIMCVWIVLSRFKGVTVDGVWIGE